MTTNVMLSKQQKSNGQVHPIVYVLKKIRNDYIQNRYTFIEGRVMIEILRFFDATEDDLIKLQYSGGELGKDPTLLFRESRNGRFLIDFQEQNIQRLKFQPFVLSADEDFVRDDSGQLRYFRGIQDNIQNNTAFQGLLKFQSYMIKGMKVEARKNLEKAFHQWVSTIFQLRTITSKDLLGEPAKEGVHSDGVEHTMTTFMHAKNMTNYSAISKIHTQDEVNGISWNKVDERFVIEEFQHRHFLDTLLIVDSELKHSLSPVNAIDKNKLSTRDMIIFFTRRPKNEKHGSFHLDSLEAHDEIPLSFKL